MTKADRRIALFDIDEIKLGKKLGSGGFSDVYEIESFAPAHDKLMSKNRRLKKNHQEARDFLMDHCTRVDTGETRYAIKFVKEALLDDCERFDCGAQDLAFEADLLAKLDHPNILKIRGWATNGYDSYFKSHRHDGYFIIVDKLNQTLTDRIAEWKKQLESVAGDDSEEAQNIRNGVQLEQLKVALDIARALEFLHKNGIIYRDLKPDNIGFDIRGETKLFDFGLAREVPEGKMDDVFRMSGKVGTARYMAPEVCLCKPYNVKADVFSFSHVFHEMLSLTKPYANFTKGMHKTQVVNGGERPLLNESWSSRVCKILAKSWDTDIAERPTMRTVRTQLRKEIAEIEQPEFAEPSLESSGVSTFRRQSTHYELEEKLKLQDKTPSKKFPLRMGRRSSVASRAA